MTQTIDAVAHHQPHGAGIEIRPYRFGAMLAFGAQKRCGHLVQSLVPADRYEVTAALGAATLERGSQSAGMMDAFGVARDLAANDASGIAVVARTAHPADGASVEFLDLQCTGGGAVVRAGAVMK